MCRASFLGTRIVLRQTSEESEAIYDLIIGLYKSVNGNWGTLVANGSVTNQDLTGFLEYAAMFLANVGNYRSTGDQKFIPRISKGAMEKLCAVHIETKALFARAVDGMYAISPYQYGYSADKDCASGYYPASQQLNKSDIDHIQQFLQLSQILPENTRVTKKNESEGLTVLIASSETHWKPTTPSTSDLGRLEKVAVSIEMGDFAEPLHNIIQELEHAQNYTANQTQKDMIHALIESFRTGNHHKFKSAQALWVQDRSPTVEAIIGFIETYQDPHGVRGAWEGIVAIVNKQQSKKFSELVDRSSEFIALLPWNGRFIGLDQGQFSEFESENFVKPDFSSLDTLGFLKSESPAGLNLPNFEDICQSVGSKNLDFGNVNNANPPDEDIPFVKPEEVEFLLKYREKAFEVMNACHELLGHGSGRLLVENEPGKYNFDPQKLPVDPITGKAIESWYKPGDSWYGLFRSDANAIEECRAEGVALLLLPNEDILKIFGYTETSEPSAQDIVYAGYLNFIYGTIKGLSSWNPETKKWGQSHRRGKFALLRCMLECGADLLTLIETDGNIKIALHRSAIKSHAIPAISKFLLALQIYRSTANVSKGVRLISQYSEVDTMFAQYRTIVVARNPPRIQYVQPNTFLEGSEVQLRYYPATKEGLIQSWVERNV